MATDELLPVVLPALTSHINGLEYRCRGEGIQMNGHAFQPTLTNYLPLLEPKRTKAGKIAVRQPKQIDKNKDWWQAQCAFRGLPHSGTLAVLQQRLRAANQSVLGSEVAATEERLNREYRQKNAEAREAEWQNPNTTDDEKANRYPARFLREAFGDGNLQVGSTDLHDNKVIVLKIMGWDHYELEYAATCLGLASSPTAAPPGISDNDGSFGRWFVVARNQSSLTQKLSEIAHQRERDQKIIDDAKKAELQKRHAELQKRATNPSSRDGKWDIFGTWAINCPYAEDNWGEAKDKCTLTIYEEGGAGKGGKHIWAEFDFAVMAGVFRFLRPASNPENTGLVESRKRKRTAPVEDDFKLGSSEAPSPSHATWEYRWRGEETGEGEIQVDSDEDIYSITFSGSHGMELHGTFGGGCFPNCQFSGVKTGERKASKTCAERKWRDFGREAYETARHARWY